MAKAVKPDERRKAVGEKLAFHPTDFLLSSNRRFAISERGA